MKRHRKPPNYNARSNRMTKTIALALTYLRDDHVGLRHRMPTLTPGADIPLIARTAADAILNDPDLHVRLKRSTPTATTKLP